MADTSGFKGGMVIALIGFAVWTYWNRSSDAAEGKTQCLSQISTANSVRNPDTVCTCMIDGMMRQISIIHHVPVIKNFVADPAVSDIMRSSLRACLGG